jgi:hypothetical protein
VGLLVSRLDVVGAYDDFSVIAHAVGI